MLLLCTLKNLFVFFSLFSFLFFFRVCLDVVYPHSLHHAQLARALFRHVHECWPAFGARLIFGTAGQFKRDLTQSPDHSRNKRLVNLSDCGCYEHVCWIQCTRILLSHHFLSCGTSRRHLPVVAENDILLSEEFVKGGCPSHLRKGLWKQVLLSHVGEKVWIFFSFLLYK
jgi:hypothetical protein